MSDTWTKKQDPGTGLNNDASHGWVERRDPIRRCSYYVNEQTGERSWERPGALKGAPSATAGTVDAAVDTAGAAEDHGWVEKTDPNSKRKYWVHSATGKSTWEQPAEVGADAAGAAGDVKSATTNGAGEAGDSGGGGGAEHGWRKYWVHSATGKSTWEQPAEVGANAQGGAVSRMKPADVKTDDSNSTGMSYSSGSSGASRGRDAYRGYCRKW
eukprot:g250.t1